MINCVVDGCEKPRKRARGRVNSRLCSMHHARRERHGDVNVSLRLGEKDWAPDPTYRMAHKHVMLKHGRAAEHSCVVCGQKAVEWAYDHRDPDERTDPARGLTYSDNPDFYNPMCRKCHAAFDGAVKPRRPPEVRGETHGMSKLTEFDVREIRRAVSAGEVGWSIAARHGISVSQVSSIARHKAWAHVS